VGTNPSADSGVVSEARAVATLPPTSLAYKTKAKKSQAPSNNFNTLTILTRRSTFPVHAEPRRARLHCFVLSREIDMLSSSHSSAARRIARAVGFRAPDDPPDNRGQATFPDASAHRKSFVLELQSR
jgi:hypothetical protein